MIEGRALIEDPDKAKQTIISLGGVFRGSYDFTDIIYLPAKKQQDLHADCLKMRIYKKNNQPSKDVILVRKLARWEGHGKTDHVILREEFDTVRQAEEFLRKKYKSKYKRGFEYSRKGWEYSLGSVRLYVEDIDKLGPTMEIEADDIKGLDLFDEFKILKWLADSVPETMRKKLDFEKGLNT